MRIVVGLFKRFAIRRYMRYLPVCLARDYGRWSKDSQYTPEQVIRTIERNKLSKRFASYAIAFFANEESFKRFHIGIGSPAEYVPLRIEIGNMMSDFALSPSVETGCGLLGEASSVNCNEHHAGHSSSDSGYAGQ